MSLGRTILIRLLLVLPVALGVVTLTFFLSRVMTGDPVELFLPVEADQQLRDEIRAHLGLDESVGAQYIKFVGNAAQGDLGVSVNTGQPVTNDLIDRLPATLELAAVALTMAMFVGIPLGVVAAIRRDGIVDFLVRSLTLTGMALPSFWFGLVLIYVFFVQFGALPGPVGRLGIGEVAPPDVTGFYTVDALLDGDFRLFWEALRHLALPGLTLGLVTLAPITRVTRSAMTDALQSEYIRTSRAMGISRTRIYFVYALRNALLPVATMVGGVIGFLSSGTVLVESIFAWPGIGRYALDAIERSDYAALQGYVLWSALVYVSVYLFIDLMYMAADPRVRKAA
jgi:peptide/nickel transport system permease protein